MNFAMDDLYILTDKAKSVVKQIRKAKGSHGEIARLPYDLEEEK